MTAKACDGCRECIEHLLAQHEQVSQERTRCLERDLARLEQLMEARMMAQATAVMKSEDAYNARFASANEFRASLDDMTRNMVNRDYVDTRFNEHSRRTNAVENRLANYDGRALGYSAGIGIVVLIISIATQLVGLGG